MVVANHNIIEHGIKVKKDYWQFGEPFRAEYLRRLMIDDVAGKWNIWGKIFKTNTLKKVYENLKLPDEIKITMAEDALVTLNFMKYVEKIKTIPCILYNYNLDNIGSSTNDVEPLKIKNNIQDLNICIKMIDNLDNCINSELKLFARYIINCLQMHRTSLEYLLEKNHFLRLFLRLKRKRIKIEKSRILSKVY
ncbi:Uncharacterised protein [Helicobacter pullorum]|uniref:hypothetical protein n=1 Tax=Helicobacter pullorum TaxID=35818 RepID=UPI000F709F0A|nr:hypothetical protein [Helicobacter pullorum]VEJ08400.1 Uncharacterised protein [Helicobacter pullorum]